MSNEHQAVTNGTYTLKETKVKNQFYFFRNDRGELGNVGTIPLELFSEYLIQKVKAKELQRDTEYRGRIFYEVSEDGKVIRMTISDNVGKNPNLRLVKSGELEVHKAAKKRPNFFRRLFAKKMFQQID